MAGGSVRKSTVVTRTSFHDFFVVHWDIYYIFQEEIKLFREGVCLYSENWPKPQSMPGHAIYLEQLSSSLLLGWKVIISELMYGTVLGEIK